MNTLGATCGSPFGYSHGVTPIIDIRVRPILELWTVKTAVGAFCVVGHNGAPAIRSVHVSMGIPVRGGIIVHIPVMASPHIVSQFMPKAVITRRTTPRDQSKGPGFEGIRNGSHQIGEAAPSSVINDEHNLIGAVGVAQRVNVVHVTIRGASEAGQCYAPIEIAFAVGHLGCVNQVQSLGDAAVGVGLVRLGHRQVDQGFHRRGAPRGRARGSSVDHQYVDC